MCQRSANRWRRVARLGLGAVVAVVAAGCTENIDGSAACPIVCADETSALQTETLGAVALDTTVLSQSGLGAETEMLLASRGDTLDSRVVLRFDQLPESLFVGAQGKGITAVDSARLIIRADTIASKNAVSVTVSVYDVDTTDAANDTSVATLEPLFTPARLVATQTFAAGTLDSMAIVLPNAFVLGKIQAHSRIRLGLRISGTQSVSALIWATGSPSVARYPFLYMRATTPDTTVPQSVGSLSRTPSNNAAVASAVRDFTLVVQGTPAPPADLLAVGGIPGHRTLLRFNLPSRIVDSSVVVRASLLLTQLPSASPAATDSMAVLPALVVAAPSLTDVSRVVQVISTTIAPLDSLRTVPGSSGVREFDVAPLFNVWKAAPDTTLPRAVVLFTRGEGTNAQQAWFYSTAAADPAVRPKLRITYTLRSRVGAP